MQGDKYPETICTIPQLSPFEQGGGVAENSTNRTGDRKRLWHNRPKVHIHIRKRVTK